MDISDAWGYGAVVVPSVLFYQGFIIHEPDRYKDDIAALMWSLRSKLREQEKETDRDISGALQAALVEVITNHADPHNLGRVAIFGSALAKFTNTRFYIVNAHHKDTVATVTTFEALPVTTPEQARDRINEKCRPIQAALLSRMVKGKFH